MNELCFVCIALASCVWIIPSLATPELKLVHVLFAHKLHAPWEEDTDHVGRNEISIPQTLSYEYFATAMSMSNDAYVNMYNLGVHLREIYNEFLGDTYMPEIMKMRTSEHTLSILSAQLVNAGLWPPSEEQMWMEDFNWQPIPTDYVKLKEDTLLLGTLCPNFLSQIDQMLHTIEMQKMIGHYELLFNYLSQHTERNISTPSDVSLLYAILETMINRNELLPDWTIDIFPDGAMYNVTLLEYDLLSINTLQRQLNGGMLLGEIISNSLRYKAGDISKERKIILYSGDQRNIIGILKNLNSWSPHIPNEAAALIFELYFDNDINMYGMKINYYTGVDDMTIPISLPNCIEICSLQILIDIAFNSIPQNAQSLCGWSVENPTEKDRLNKSEFNSANNNIFCHNSLMVIIILLFLNNL